MHPVTRTGAGWCVKKSQRGRATTTAESLLPRVLRCSGCGQNLLKGRGAGAVIPIMDSAETLSLLQPTAPQHSPCHLRGNTKYVGSKSFTEVNHTVGPETGIRFRQACGLCPTLMVSCIAVHCLEQRYHVVSRGIVQLSCCSMPARGLGWTGTVHVIVQRSSVGPVSAVLAVQLLLPEQGLQSQLRVVA